MIESVQKEREDINEVEERLELVTVEKEMAEEKVEILQVSFILCVILHNSFKTG